MTFPIFAIIVILIACAIIVWYVKRESHNELESEDILKSQEKTFDNNIPSQVVNIPTVFTDTAKTDIQPNIGQDTSNLAQITAPVNKTVPKKKKAAPRKTVNKSSDTNLQTANLLPVKTSSNKTTNKKKVAKVDLTKSQSTTESVENNSDKKNVTKKKVTKKSTKSTVIPPEITQVAPIKNKVHRKAKSVK